MSLKESIGWCSMTCNPIKGLCQGGCWYCYYSGKRGIAHRFKQDPELRLDLSVFDKLPKVPKKVFLCSTNDYWGNWVPDEWREAIREKTQQYPQHTFQVLTKQYQNLPKYSPYPDNWSVGVTVTGKGRDELLDVAHVRTRLLFISFEPLLASVSNYLHLIRNLGIGWVIIGRFTGYGHKHDPKLEWVEEIVRACDKARVKVFLKDNLMPLFDYPNPLFFRKTLPAGSLELRQELPSG